MLRIRKHACGDESQIYGGFITKCLVHVCNQVGRIAGADHIKVHSPGHSNMEKLQGVEDQIICLRLM